MEIKKVNINDAGQLLFEMDNKAFTRPFDIPSKTVDEQIQYLKKSEVYMVYEKNIPVGFFAYEIQDRNVDVKSMVVLPEQQGKGIGQFMMKNLLDLTKEYHVQLVTHPNNSQAIIFYLKSGFEITGWKDNYYGDYEPRLMLQLKK